MKNEKDLEIEAKRAKEALSLLKEQRGYQEYLDVIKNLYKMILKQLSHTRLFDDKDIQKGRFLQAQLELLEAIVPITWESALSEAVDEQLDE